MIASFELADSPAFKGVYDAYVVFWRGFACLIRTRVQLENVNEWLKEDTRREWLEALKNISELDVIE